MIHNLCSGTTTGKSLTVKSSKIVAGQEPDKTNELLQCLAVALDKKLSSDEAVKKYKDSVRRPNGTPSEIKQKDADISKAVKQINDPRKLKSKSNEKLTTSKKEPATVNRSDNKTSSESKIKKENQVVKKEIQPKKSQLLKNKNPAIAGANKTELLADLKVIQNVTEKEGKQKENINKNEDENLLKKSSDTEKENDDQKDTSTSKGPIIESDQEFNGKLNSSYTIDENELNSSLSSQDILLVENSTKPTENVVEHITNDVKYQDQVSHKQNLSDKENKILPMKSVETALSRDDSTDSADKSVELEKSKNNDHIIGISSIRKSSDVVRPPSVRPSSSRPGAPRLREKIDNVLPENDNILLAKVNIIAENTNNEDVSKLFDFVGKQCYSH